MDREVSPGGGDTLTTLRPLDAVEVRLLAEAQLLELRDFARSPRLHAVDGKGDTPLHIAARCGKLALCDMLIRHGADPNVTNSSDQTPADVAASEGHLPLSQLLQALEQESEADSDLVLPMNSSSSRTAGTAMSVPAANTTDPVEFDLSFEAEADPHSFRHHGSEGVSEREQAAFIPAVAAGSADEAPDWELDLSQAPLAGDGIHRESTVVEAQQHEGEFLVTQSRGRKSTKPALMPVGTNMSIDASYCRQWAEEAVNSHRVPAADFDALISSCRGNADGDDCESAPKADLRAGRAQRIDCIKQSAKGAGSRSAPMMIPPK